MIPHSEDKQTRWSERVEAGKFEQFFPLNRQPLVSAEMRTELDEKREDKARELLREMRG